MIGYRCKCGKATGSSSMGFPDCQGCKECNTTFASHPDHHKELAPHKWATKYNENTGKPYDRCERCYEVNREQYQAAKQP